MSSHPWHWRRHPESVTADKVYTAREFADKTVVATACGRLVDYQQAVGDVADVDCDECQKAARYLGTPGVPQAAPKAPKNQNHEE